jgi:hypothetical protein
VNAFASQCEKWLLHFNGSAAVILNIDEEFEFVAVLFLLLEVLSSIDQMLSAGYRSNWKN